MHTLHARGEGEIQLSHHLFMFSVEAARGILGKTEGLVLNHVSIEVCFGKFPLSSLKYENHRDA